MKLPVSPRAFALPALLIAVPVLWLSGPSLALKNTPSGALANSVKPSTCPPPPAKGESRPPHGPPHGTPSATPNATPCAPKPSGTPQPHPTCQPKPTGTPKPTATPSATPTAVPTASPTAVPTAPSGGYS